MSWVQPLIEQKSCNTVPAGQKPVYQGKLTASRDKKNEVVYDTNWGNGILNIGNGKQWNTVMSATQESVNSSTVEGCKYSK